MAASRARYLVSPDELRQRFNAGRYWERTLTDEFAIERRNNREPSPASGQPLGSRSQTWYYFSRQGRQLVKVAVVHQFQRPDGHIGGWGRPDPKWLLGDDGAEYYVQ